MVSFELFFSYKQDKTKELTGARANALSINNAPNISIKNPINHGLFKAYAFMTCKQDCQKLSSIEQC